MLHDIISDEQAIHIASRLLEQDFGKPKVERKIDDGIQIIEVSDELDLSEDYIEIDSSFNVNSKLGNHCNMVEVYRFIENIRQNYLCQDCNGTGWNSYPNHDTTHPVCHNCEGRGYKMI